MAARSLKRAWMGRMTGGVRVLSLLALLLVALPGTAISAQEYDPKRAGHPLRVVAYVLHPAGVILDYLIFRPAWWMGTHEPLRTLFGVRVVPSDDPDPDSAPQTSAVSGPDDDLHALPGPRPRGN